MECENLTITKAIIYAYKRVSISTIQRKLYLRYPIVVELLEQLEQKSLLKTEQGERVINWQHSDWQILAQHPQLWQKWLQQPIADELYQYRLEQNEQGWCILRECGSSQQLVTFVDNQEEGLCWLSEKQNLRISSQ